MKRQFISWRRVSTWKQGKDGLGMESQKDLIDGHVELNDGELVADYAEVYTGTDLGGCAQLRRAMEHAKSIGATLIIAKTDRFRNDTEALRIYDEMTDNDALRDRIYFCDYPNADRLILGIMFILAANEARNISIRTKAALRAKKKAGAKLGRSKGCDMTKAGAASVESKKVKARANEHNERFRLWVAEYEATNGTIDRHTDVGALVGSLNRLRYLTSTGMEFTIPRFRSMLAKVRTLYKAA